VSEHSRKIPLAIALGAVVVLLLALLLVLHAESKTNKVSLAESSRPVSVITAQETSYRATRHYIGTLRPWVEANVGPQFISAYVQTVLVRPGAQVKRGAVLATLDCRQASSATKAIAQQARSIEMRQKALADEAARTKQLLGQGFVSENAVEQQQAQSESQEAQLQSQRASLARSNLEVDDCALRAPFDGDIGERFLDPGAFVHPGNTIVTVIDRTTIRMVIDVPESDFSFVAPNTPAKVHVLALNRDLDAHLSRRAPSADPGTRTVHVEADLSNRSREIPVNTTAELRIEIGQPVQAVEVPLYAASVNNEKATLFVVEGDAAKSVALPVLGELGGSLFFDPAKLKPGSQVVAEGRALLKTGDKISIHDSSAPAPREQAATVISGKADAR
jgi:membrane fusion protein (multidrug efflux system)